MTEETTLRSEIKAVKDLLANADPKQIKKIKLGKAKVKGGKMKKGFIGVIHIKENRVLTGEKVKVEDGTLFGKDGIPHASDGKEIFWWEGKFPVILQADWRLNPVKIGDSELPEANETFGHKLVEKKMLERAEDGKKKKGGGLGGWVWFIVIVIAGYFILHQFHLFGL